MIKIDLIKIEGKVLGFKSKGHALTDVYGKDLLCAAVSAIITGGFNAFRDEDIIQISLDEGFAQVIIKDGEAKIILDTIITQLKTLEMQYPKNINIK